VACSTEFSVQLASTGRVLVVPPDRTIVEVLRDAGIDVPTSCEAGLCATCKTRYLSGTPEHHDLVLSEAEQATFVALCCARSTSAVLVLDL
jgi:vanillate O-demethylase ferredoxin subunit